MALKTIVLITNNINDGACGVGDYTIRLAEALINMDVNIHILFTVPLNNRQIFRNPNIQLHQQNIDSSLKNYIEKCFDKHTTAIVWQYTPNLYSKRGLPFQILNIFRQIKQGGYHQDIFFHEASVRAFGHGIKQWLLAVMQQFICRRLALMATKSMTNIAFNKQYLKPAQVSIVPVGANIMAPARMEKADGGFIVFCFSNKLNVEALKCFYELSRDIKEFKVVIAGNCTLSQQSFIQNGISKYQLNSVVDYRSILEATDLANTMSTCDILLQPGTVVRGEGGVSFKNGSLIAAMQMGLPIISNKGDMTDEGFTHLQNIVFANGTTEHDYYKAIKLLYSDAVLKEAVGANARAYYETHLSWPVIASRILNIINAGA